jgi:hypothetical protein
MSTYRHHRGSIFWALTLIAIGVLFLYENLNHDIHPWRLIALYWPVLIIFWGISKLIDYLHARAHPEESPHPLFSGGEVVLLIVVLLIGTALSKIILGPHGNWPSIMGMNDQQFAELFFNSYTYTQKVSKEVQGSPRLLIVNRRGNVEIHGADQQSIGATIQETVWAENETTARNIADQLKFQITENAGLYELTSNLDSLPHGGRTIRLDMVLLVPKSTTAEVTDNEGDVTISGLKGNQTVTARGGDVNAGNIEGAVVVHQSRGATTIRDVDGSVEIRGRGGDLAVQNVTGSVTVDGSFSGSAQFENIAQTLRYNSSRTSLDTQKLTGSLSMDMGNLQASGVGGPFNLDTRDKDISLKDFKFNVRISSTNGDVQLQTSTPPTHPIEVDLKKGDITLILPPTSSFQMAAVSHNGEVSCDFPGLTVSKEPPAPAISGSYGKNGPPIRLTSTYGTIRVLREQPQTTPATGTTAAGIRTHSPRLKIKPISISARPLALIKAD